MNEEETATPPSETQSQDQESGDNHQNIKFVELEEVSFKDTQQYEDKSLEKPKSELLSFLVIYGTVFVDLMGFGIVIPLLPFFAITLGATGFTYGLIFSSFSVCAFFGSIILGRISDRYGRRPVILFSLLGSVVGHSILAFASSLEVVILARSVAGVFGGSVSVAQAYIADKTAPSDRTKYMGLLGASMGAGLVLGPAIGGLVGKWGFSVAAFIAAGMSAVNLLVGWAVLKESLDPKNIAEKLSFQQWKNELMERKHILLIFAAIQVTFPIYGADYLNLTPNHLGWIFSLFGVVIIIIQGGVIPQIRKRLGWSEKSLAIGGSVGITISLAALVFVPTLSYAYGSIVGIAIFIAVLQPVLPSLLSIHSPPTSQGTFLGIFQSIGAAARAIAPALLGALYDVSPRSPLLGSAGIMLLIVAFVFFLPSTTDAEYQQVDLQSGAVELEEVEGQV